MFHYVSFMRCFRLLSLVCLITMVLPPQDSAGATTITPVVETVSPSGSLYRTTVMLEQPTDIARVKKLGVSILHESLDQLLVLADGEQIAALAHLGFELQNTDEVSSLVQVNATLQPQATTNLHPLVAQIQAMRESQALASIANTPTLTATVQSLSPQQQADLAVLAVADSDNDGLTDTQESWWCTNPNLADSDGDRTSDGAEVQALKDWLGNKRSSPPSSGKPFAGWPSTTNGCRDDDYDSVPDLAESLELGLNPNFESTDRDQFDDGQELFGTTNCPGSGGSCGYGSLPPANTANLVLFPQMPSWVKAPGNHPLVAALPTIGIDIAANSLVLERVTEITTEKGTMTQNSKSYSTAKTEGTSSSVADTVTWNEWQEVAQTTPQVPLIRSSQEPIFLGVNLSSTTTNSSDRPQYDSYNSKAESISCLANIGVGFFSKKGGVWGAATGVATGCINFLYGLGQYWYDDTKYMLQSMVGSEHTVTAPDDSGQASGGGGGGSWGGPNVCNPQVYGPCGSGAKAPNNQQIIQDQAANTASQNRSNANSGTSYNRNVSSNFTAQKQYPVGVPLVQPWPSQTISHGSSHGGAQTTTHTQYEELTVTDGQAFTTGEDWRTATAANSAHAADLRFTYTLQNTGTDFARKVCEIAFNVYIGDNPNPVQTYDVAPELGGDGCLSSIRPDPTVKITRTSHSLPLSLDLMQAIDTGAPIRIVMARYVLSTEDYYAQDAASAGVRIAIEDGTEDGDEQIDNYLIPTWGDEKVLDVLGRYFPKTTDVQGNLVAIWTPEYRSDTPAWCDEPRRATGSNTLWCKHALSTADWWNVYLDGLGDGSEGFQDTAAASGTVALFRFNQDTDHDGYGDRSEVRLGTDPRDAASVPHPELIAGVYQPPAVNGVATVTLSLLNTGVYDAYGVEAVMLAPDDSISILNNTVGGSGRVRAQKQIVVGSRILPPTTGSTWHGTAVPSSGGYYTGQQNRTYTFTVTCTNPAGCVVGSATWSLAWSDGVGSGALNLAGYRSPRMLDVAQGVQVSFLTGTVFNGDRFTIEADTPRDTFQYRINRTPFTPPLVIVSYNDPQGNHRFALPPAALALTSPTDSLQPFSGQMLQEPGVELITTDPFHVGANTTRIVVNNPSSTTLRNARLLLDFIDPEGKVVHETSTSVTLDSGPTIVPITWNSSSFTPAYDAKQDYIVMAFWTDYEGNILDTAGRPLSSFQADPTAHAVTDNAAIWNFGTARRGTALKRAFPFANTGGMRLFTYITTPLGINVAQGNGRRVGPADVTTYDVNLDTSALPAGSYDQSIKIRTSDPANPNQTIHIIGTITDATIDAPPAAVPQRPLDVSVPVASGTQGSWVEFTHTLGPEPQSLHPVRVYSQDYGRLWGVGRYATDFGQGTASAEMFGDGRDGDLVVGTGQTITIDTIRTNVSGENIFVFPATSDGFAVGDTVMFHQSQGTANAGRWEINQITAITSATSWTLAKPLLYRYDNSNGRAQVIKVPQFHDVTVQAGGVLTAPAWDGSLGGLLFFRANGTTNINGALDMNGKGFRGGNYAGYHQRAYSGEGFVGSNVVSPSANGNGGGGAENASSGDAHSSGGGGGNGTSGSVGFLGHGTRGSGGNSVGDSTLTSIFLGGGGGGGVCGWERCGSGTGGNGGGIVAFFAQNISVTGAISSRGTGGQNGDQGGWAGPGAGGGGAGGSIFIATKSGNSASNAIDASYGAGGTVWDGGRPSESGRGGVGRIRLEYCEEFVGSANPSASTQKLNCFMAEQVETSPYTKGRVNLPESFSDGRTYQVQYGRRFNFPFAAEGTSALRVPGGIATNVTLDALVSGVGNGPVTVRLDIGNDGIWDWETTQNVNGATPLASSDLSAAFNSYWSSHGAPVNSIDVPIRMSFSKAGQVVLSNLQVTRTGSSLRALRLPAGNYSLATLNLAIGTSGSGPLTIAADVGDNGSIDWTWSGTPAFPARLLSGNMASAINAYMSGRSGDVDVPVRFYLNPFLPLTLTSTNTSLTAQPDTVITAGDISFSTSAPVASMLTAANIHLSSITPTEGDTVTVAATLHNVSNQPTGAVAAAVFANVPGWGDWYVGSQYVSNIPSGGSTSITVPWNTTGFSGDVPVRVVIDPYNRLAEGNETNNQANTTLAIRALAKPAVTLSTPSLSFGSQTVGSASLAQTVMLTNTGTADLTTDTIAINGNFSANNTCPGTVAPGAACTISVVFVPTAAGNRNGTLVISSNAPSSPHGVSLNGLGVGDTTTPAISLSAISLNFLRQSVGKTSEGKEIVVTNNGTASLAMNAIAISGDFARTSTCPSLLDAGASCTVTITFTPLQEGNRTGTLTFTTNAPGLSPTVTLSGIGASTISLSAEGLSFGDRKIGSTSPPQTITLTNPGSKDMTIIGIAADGDFAQTNTCSTTLAAGTSCAVNITFTPTALGSRNGTLIVNTDDSSSPHTVNLVGNGTAVPTGITLSSNRLDFGEQPIGVTSQAQTVTLTNNSGAAIAISAVATDNDFSQTHTCPATLGAGSTCMISVTFTPRAAGSRNGALRITTSEASSPRTVSLDGTGVQVPQRSVWLPIVRH